MSDFRLYCFVTICIAIPLVFLPFWVSAVGRWITPLRRFACWIGWHSPSSLWEHPLGKPDLNLHLDAGAKHLSLDADNRVAEWRNDPTGFLSFARCPWCKHEGQIDSQGNLS